MENGNKKPQVREVDVLAGETLSRLNRGWQFMRKTKIKTWQAICIIAFVAGLSTAFLVSVALRIQTMSDAAGGANLGLTLDETVVGNSVMKDDIFNVDINLRTNSNKVVVVKAILNYDPAVFQYQSVNTQAGAFSISPCGLSYTVLCAIVDNDSANGKLSITVSKPSPGVNDDMAVVATVSFKALKLTAPNASSISIDYSGSADDYTDSDVIPEGDGSAGDILRGPGDGFDWVDTLSIMVNQYCDSVVPSGRDPVCQVDPSSADPTKGILIPDLIVTPENCTMTAEQEQQYATQTPCDLPECTYTCGEYGTTCNPDNRSSLGGYFTRECVLDNTDPCYGEPVTQEECTPPDTDFCTKVEYSSTWSDCQGKPNSSDPHDGQQTRTVTTEPKDCTIPTEKTEPTVRSCAVPDCTYTYKWSDYCHSDGNQNATVSSSPAFCVPGNPVLKRSCGKNDSRDDDDKDKDKKKSSDKKKPDISIPAFLNKIRGAKIWWTGTDNKGVKYYRYKFNSKDYVKTTKSYFNIPSSTPKGIYILRIRAYDKAGNSRLKMVTIRVR